MMTKVIIFRKATLFLYLAAAMILTLLPTQARATGFNLSVTVNPNVPMITIVDQANGAIMSCTAFTSTSGITMTASCVNLGTSTVSSTLPTPPVGLSVYASPVVVATTDNPPVYTYPNYLVNGDQGYPGQYEYYNSYLAPIWIINNSTGGITFCYTHSGLSGTSLVNTGSCTSLGVAP